MDVLTLQWGWWGGYPVGGPTPPAPPTPSAAVDGAALPGGDTLGRSLAPSLYWRDKRDPWADILAWLRDLTGPTQEFQAPGILKKTPEQIVDDARNVTLASRLTRLTRRRR